MLEPCGGSQIRDGYAVDGGWWLGDSGWLVDDIATAEKGIRLNSPKKEAICLWEIVFGG